MLFTSPTFLFVFLPLVLLVFYALSAFALRGPALAWLFGSSLLFYGWEDPEHLLPLMLFSAAFNYLVGRRIARKGEQAMLAFGIIVDLCLLAYFKYANFIAENLAFLGVPPLDIKLPIGISFFTFTQIAFLVDCYRKEANEYNPVHYGLFVTYFPHLVAGPILHHKEMMPQFANPPKSTAYPDFLLTGLCWFAAGFFKKVVFADGIEPYATVVFDAAHHGTAVGFGEAWLGALAYSLQLYFDFSGYSDMAIGLALMFGIAFPMNFNSPGKATSLIDFWRRWHITLSRFLRDYLYIPLGGNRHGPLRRYFNLFLTMLLGGFWHGAAWTFLVWGALHGLGLLVNHAWRTTGAKLPAIAGWAVTATFVVFAWVPFRAPDLTTTVTLWKSMVSVHGFVGGTTGWIWVAVLSAILLAAPNTNELFLYNEEAPLFPGSYKWRASAPWAALGGLAFGASLGFILGGQPTTFLYFRF